MQSNYLIVDRRILPDYYEKVVQARDMLREGRVKEVSEAVKLVGISRSTYYKYKDYIFAPSNETACKKAVFAFMLSHQQGVLSEVLNKFSRAWGKHTDHNPEPAHTRQRQRSYLRGYDKHDNGS